MKAFLALILAGTLEVATVRTTRVDRLEIAVTRAEDVRALKKLQRAYGYYADRGLWEELAESLHRRRRRGLPEWHLRRQRQHPRDVHPEPGAG